MKSAREIRKVMCGILVGLIVTGICIVGMERHITLQRQISHMIERRLEGVFGSQITIGSIQSDLLNSISMKHVNLKDTMGNDFLYIGRLLVKYDLMSLFQRGYIRINKVQLYGLDLKIRREDMQAEPNYAFLIDALQSKDTLDSDRKLKVDVKSVLVRNGAVSYDIISEPDTLQAFDAHHVRLNDVNLYVKVSTLQTDTLDAVVERLSAKERSGFELRECTMNLNQGKHHMKVEHLKCRLPNTQLDSPVLTLHYDTLASVMQWSDSIAYEGDVAAKITPNDLAMFVSLFKGKTQHIMGKVSVIGRGSDLMLRDIAIDGDSCVNLRGSLAVNGLTQGTMAQVSAEVNQLTLNKSVLQSWGNMDNAIMNRLEQVDVTGLAKGKICDFNFRGDAKCKAGLVAADLSVKDIGGKPLLNGSIRSERFDMGMLLGDARLGMADVSLDMNDRTCTFDTFVTLAKGNGDVSASGSVSLQHDFPTGDIDVALRKIRPKELDLIQTGDSMAVSLNLTAYLTGNSLETAQGTLHIDSLQFYSADTLSYVADNIVLNVRNKGGRQKDITLDSPFLKGNVEGTFQYSSLPRTLRQLLASSMPVLSDVSTYPEDNNSIRFDCKLTDAELLSRVLDISLKLNRGVEFSGQLDGANRKLSVRGNAADIVWDGTRYEASTLLCEVRDSIMNCHVRTGQYSTDGSIMNIAATASAHADSVKTSVNWGNNTVSTYSGKLEMDALLSHLTVGDKASLHADISINPTQVFLNDTVWNIRAAKVVIDSRKVCIDNFVFEHGSQYVNVNGVIGNHAADTCLLRLNQMNLSYFLDMVKFDDVMFKGEVSGRVMLKNVKGDMDMQARLDIDDFYTNGGLMGHTVIDARWDKEAQGISFTADMQESEDNYTKIIGYMSPKRSELDLKIYPHGIQMALLDYFTEGSVSDISGRVTGYVHLFGGLKSLDFEGGVITDNVKMKIDDINTSFVIPHDSVTLSAGRFNFPHIQVTDAEGNLGVLDGYISHRHLKKIGLHLKVDSRNMLFYDEREAGNNTFYGRLYGTGNMSLESTGNGIDIVGDVETGVGTTFTCITGINTEATSNQFITYVDKTPQHRHEIISPEIYHYQNERQPQTNDSQRSDLRIKVNVGVNKNAQMRVVMDPVSGDDIVAYGNGNLQIDYYNKGDFNVYGTYVVDEGKYAMSMQDIIHKELVLQRGGSVSFTGNSANTTIDMKAVHTVNSASLADLDANANMKGKVKVNCIMQLSGLLSDPNIKFDLELPQISEEDRALVHAATNTEEMMNTQIIYLLGIGKFYAYDAANASQSSNGASSLAFSTLSGQLNNMLSSWMNSTNWNVGANFSTGERGWTDVEAEAMLSGRLLNNRLQINGNFGYKENVLSNTNFIGDFEAVWLLTKNGEWRIRGYNETNDRYFYKNALNTQGIGLIYNKDFNQWSSLWHK